MSSHNALKRFLCPAVNKGFIIRISLVAAVAIVFFGYVCIPFTISGRSMAPTFRDGEVNFCWRPAFAFSPPRRHDIVAVRFAGQHVMLLKRVVALENETVAFQDGRLRINGKPLREPYVAYPCDWNLAPRTVKTGHVYLIGDNRSVPIQQHDFGQTRLERIIGAPLWHAR